MNENVVSIGIASPSTYGGVDAVVVSALSPRSTRCNVFVGVGTLSLCGARLVIDAAAWAGGCNGGGSSVLVGMCWLARLVEYDSDRRT
jgi:hypothetical protein